MKASHRNELARALRNGHFEDTGNGILLPKQGLFIGGSGRIDLNGQDRSLIPNLFSTEGLLYVLGTAFAGASQGLAFYLAPFAGTAAPDATLTGANFTARQTEFTNYSESTRVAWTGVLEGTPQVDNGAALSTFTINQANSTVYGFALLTNQVKQATTGKLVACFKDAAPRTNLQVGDKLNVEYVITAQDAG